MCDDDWSKKIFSIVDGLVQGDVSVMVYVCALRIMKAVSFS